MRYKIYVPKYEYRNWKVFTDNRYKTHTIEQLFKLCEAYDNKEYSLNWAEQRFFTFNLNGDLSKYNTIIIQPYNAYNQDNSYVVKINKIEYLGGNQEQQKVYCEIDNYYDLKPSDLASITGFLKRTNLKSFTYDFIDDNQLRIQPTITSLENLNSVLNVNTHLKVLDNYVYSDYVFYPETFIEFKELPADKPKSEIIRKPLFVQNKYLHKVKEGYSTNKHTFIDNMNFWYIPKWAKDDFAKKYINSNTELKPLEPWYRENKDILKNIIANEIIKINADQDIVVFVEDIYKQYFDLKVLYTRSNTVKTIKVNIKTPTLTDSLRAMGFDDNVSLNDFPFLWDYFTVSIRIPDGNIVAAHSKIDLDTFKRSFADVLINNNLVSKIDIGDALGFFRVGGGR